MGNHTTSMNINVIDNFFSEEIHKEVYHKFIKTSKWSFTGGNNSNPFWHIDGLEKDEYFNNIIGECPENEKLYVYGLFLLKDALQ